MLLRSRLDAGSPHMTLRQLRNSTLFVLGNRLCNTYFLDILIAMAPILMLQSELIYVRITSQPPNGGQAPFGLSIGFARFYFICELLHLVV